MYALLLRRFTNGTYYVHHLCVHCICTSGRIEFVTSKKSEPVSVMYRVDVIYRVGVVTEWTLCA